MIKGTQHLVAPTALCVFVKWGPYQSFWEVVDQFCDNRLALVKEHSIEVRKGRSGR